MEVALLGLEKEQSGGECQCVSVCGTQRSL